MTELERRVAKLEAAQGSGDGTADWIEREWTAEEQQLLREVWTGLHPPEQNEAMLVKGYRGPGGELSKEDRALLAEARESLRDPAPSPRTRDP
jgi:hypothetical protein